MKRIIFIGKYEESVYFEDGEQCTALCRVAQRLIEKLCFKHICFCS